MYLPGRFVVKISVRGNWVQGSYGSKPQTIFSNGQECQNLLSRSICFSKVIRYPM